MKATIRTAALQAIYESMKVDSRIFLIGEGSRVKHSFDKPEVLEDFPERVLTAPVSEGGIVGVALGSALAGMRPIVDLTFNDLALRAMDEIINHVAKVHFMTGGKAHARVVIKADFNRPENAQSGNRLESIFLHTPGLRVAVPSTPSDAHSLMRSALTADDPVLFFEDRIIAAREEIAPLRRSNFEFGKARVVRRGSTLTLVSYGCTLHFSLEAIRSLSNDIVEVIDLRTLSPLDIETIRTSVSKTRKLLIVEPDHLRLGIGAEIAAEVSHSLFDKLEAPVTRIGTADLLFPAAPSLHKSLLPSVAKIREAVLGLITRPASGMGAGKE